jgi:FkbH-like protein
MLAIPSYSEIQELLNNMDFKEYPKLRISVLRNITIEPIGPYLSYFAYKMGFDAIIKYGEYDNIFQEAVGGLTDLLCQESDAILVFMNLDILSWSLARNFAGLTLEQIESEVNTIKNNVYAIIRGIRDQTNAMILWHGFESPAYPSLGIVDNQKYDGQSTKIRELNEFLRQCLKTYTNSYFVDLNLCLSLIGIDNYFDQRYWHIGRAPFSRKALELIAYEDFKFLRAQQGKNKKCMVLDCDNTLWGGVIGEDGITGIKLGKTYPGSAYYEFQQEITNFYHRGIIIALCSKNNEEDVWEVFRKHPDMVLKEEYIAAFRINWNDKASNLQQIADDLNIGLESIVFIDDSEFEVNLIRQLMPEVEVIHLHPNKAITYRSILASCGLFDTLTISEEDKMRGAMYRAETFRKKLHSQTTDIETYYKSLEMIAEIKFVDEFSIPRVAQLTQKTNQFNLTTKRYTEADIKTLAEQHNSDVFYIKVYDKFGDSGIVGACILRYQGSKAVIDSFLLSCRILGRYVEDIFLRETLKLAQKKGYSEVIGQFFATKKNSQAAQFYVKQGFSEIEDTKCGSDKEFYFKFSEKIEDGPNFFKSIISDIDDAR